MAIETVQSVRQAELLAAQKEKDAESEAEKIILESETVINVRICVSL